MKTWTRIPVFRLLVPFSLGILYGLDTDTVRLTHCLFFSGSVLLHVLFTVRRYATGKHASRWLAGIPSFMAWMAAGFVSIVLFTGKPSSTIQTGESRQAIIITRGHGSWSGSAVRIRGTIRMLNHETGWIAVDIPVMIRISEAVDINPEPGDLILINATPKSLSAPLNPGQFDYSSYLRKKGIHYQVQCTGDKAVVLRKQYESGIINLALPLRNAAAQTLKRALPDSALLGIAAALVLGEERWLDEQVEAGYKGAGVLHVLCVSGMHVVLLLTIIENLLTLVKIPVRHQWIRHVFLIGLTWYYTSLTGFSPSIVRAAAMMTLILTGKLLSKQGNLPNMLAGCAMVMIVTAPGYLFDAGFQLSFLAVIGIVFIHDRLRWVVEPTGKFGVMIRDLVSVTLSAQAATFPLSLYYFGQFPNYFLVANLVIVPLSTWVLYLGMLLLCTAWIPFISDLIIFLTDISVRILNGFTLWIASLPHAVTTDVYITGIEFGITCALVICLFRLIFTRGHSWLTSSLVLVILLNSSFIWNRIAVDKTRELTIFHFRNETVITIVSGGAAQYIGTVTDTLKADRMLHGYLVSKGVDKVTYRFLKPGQGLVLDEKKIPMICINGKEKIQINNSGKFPGNAYYVFDGSVSKGKAEKIMEANKIPSHQTWFTSTMGAWQYQINR